MWCQGATRSTCFPGKLVACAVLNDLSQKYLFIHVQVSIGILLYSLMGFKQLTERPQNSVLASQIPAVVAAT